MPYIMKLLGLVEGESPFDDQYLVEYDPTRPGVDPTGRPMYAHIVTTPDPAKAMRFADHMAGWECWKREHGMRTDGRPNRPLTAFSVTFEQVP